MERTCERPIRCLVGGVLLLAIFVGALIVLTIHQERLIIRETHASADRLLDSIVLVRRWNANYGGVYVEKRPGVESSPYLESHDIASVSGQVYTLRNPALMTREISEYARADGEFAFRLTSLKPVNPSNAPDAWERSALEGFEKGGAQLGRVVDFEDRKAYRLMRPLYYEADCVVCHSNQGYEIGQVRGGISVTVPFEETHALLWANRVAMGSFAAALLIASGLVLYFFVWRMMNRLTAQNHELVELNDVKNRFLGIAAHDLRNPLTAIHGYLCLLKNEFLRGGSSAYVDMVNRMSRQTQTMLSLINDLLDYSTIEAGKLEIHKERVDVLEFLRDQIEANQMLAGRKSMSLRLEISEGPTEIELDRNRMGQVISNLVSNAIKFSNPGSAVVLGARLQDSEFVIYVRDRGNGIPPEELSKLFSDFSRTSVRPTAGERSTGLGLAIARRMTEAHGGRIWVESRPGEGSTFSVALPLSCGAEADDQARGRDTALSMAR